MSSNNGTSPLGFPTGNPYPPFAFYPPAVAYQASISIYSLVAALVVMIWDMLNTVNADYRLLTQYRIGFPTIVYFISRFASLGHLLSLTIVLTAPIGHCFHIWRGISWLYVVALPATSLLFFFRVRAMYNGNIYVTLFFSFMWLAVLGGSLTTIQAISFIPLGTTGYCISGKVETYLIAASLIPLVNDTLVFIAITWRLVRCSRREVMFTSGMGSFILGRHLPAFSRSLLQDGQAYYLSTVGLSFLTVTFQIIKAIPISYSAAISFPDTALINIMACRVYRNTKFGIFRETTTDIILPPQNSDMSITFRGGNSSVQSSSSTQADVEGGLPADERQSSKER